MAGKSILITGGTGSFGANFVKSCLRTKKYSKVVIFSRDELKQYELKQTLGDDERLRLLSTLGQQFLKGEDK